MLDSNIRIMVILNRNGKWEVLKRVATVGSEERWHHAKYFQTEQEAEVYARSLLPNCDAGWDEGTPNSITKGWIHKGGRTSGMKPRHYGEE